jgi:hypothetical protein
MGPCDTSPVFSGIRLDDHALGVRAPRTRRHALQLLAGTVAGGLVASFAPGRAAAQYRCDSDAVVFSDGFETGGLGRWDAAEGLEIQQYDVYDGDYAVRADSNGQPRFARARLPGTYDDLYLRIWFNAERIPHDEWVYLMKLRTAGDDPILSLAIDDNGTLCYRPDAMYPDDQYVPGEHSDVYVVQGRWHELQARLHVDGSDSWVEVWYDGRLVPDLGNAHYLGNAGVGSIQIGESLSARAFDVRFDNVVAATEFCGNFFW